MRCSSTLPTVCIRVFPQNSLLISSGSSVSSEEKQQHTSPPPKEPKSQKPGSHNFTYLPHTTGSPGGSPFWRHPSATIPSRSLELVQLSQCGICPARSRQTQAVWLHFHLALLLCAAPCDPHCLLPAQQPQAKLMITQTPGPQATHSGRRVCSE